VRIGYDQIACLSAIPTGFETAAYFDTRIQELYSPAPALSSAPCPQTVQGPLCAWSLFSQVGFRRSP